MAFEDYTPEEVEAIVTRYEFLAERADQIKIIHSNGDVDKIFHEQDGVEALNESIDTSMQQEKDLLEDDEEDEDDEDYEELSF